MAKSSHPAPIAGTIFTIGHSELDNDSLPNLETVSRRTNALYKAASAVDDINKSLTQIKDSILKMWVVEWKTELDHDGKDHKIDVAMENDVSTLKEPYRIEGKKTMAYELAEQMGRTGLDAHSGSES